MSRGPTCAERCREAESALSDVARLKVRCEMSLASRCAERWHEAEGGLRDVARLMVTRLKVG